MLGLVELDNKTARDLEARNQAIAAVLNFMNELDSSRPKLTYCLSDVIAVEGDIGSERNGVFFS